jgi:hypothetical protein
VEHPPQCLLPQRHVAAPAQLSDPRGRHRLGVTVVHGTRMMAHYPVGGKLSCHSAPGLAGLMVFHSTLCSRTVLNVYTCIYSGMSRTTVTAGTAGKWSAGLIAPVDGTILLVNRVVDVFPGKCPLAGAANQRPVHVPADRSRNLVPQNSYTHTHPGRERTRAPAANPVQWVSARQNLRPQPCQQSTPTDRQRQAGQQHGSSTHRRNTTPPATPRSGL